MFGIKIKRKKKIKNVIFDFGGVILNLDKEATKRELNKLGLQSFDDEMIKVNELYEVDKISTPDFLSFYYKKIPGASFDTLKEAWNSILLDLPKYRMDFIKETAKTYKVYLLSNINEMHLKSIRDSLGDELYVEFLYLFDMVFYSHLTGMRKPDKATFEFVLKRNDLSAKETLFIDDTKEHCDAARELGFKVWHIDTETEDIAHDLHKHL